MSPDKSLFQTFLITIKKKKKQCLISYLTNEKSEVISQNVY